MKIYRHKTWDDLRSVVDSSLLSRTGSVCEHFRAFESGYIRQELQSHALPPLLQLALRDPVFQGRLVIMDSKAWLWGWPSTCGRGRVLEEWISHLVSRSSLIDSS